MLGTQRDRRRRQDAPRRADPVAHRACGYHREGRALRTPPRGRDEAMLHVRPAAIGVTGVNYDFAKLIGTAEEPR